MQALRLAYRLCILFAAKIELPREDAKFIDRIETITAQNLSFRYTDQSNYILDDVSFKVNNGEMIAVTGPSGSGKSTLIKIISGLYETSAGQILINGADMKSIKNARLSFCGQGRKRMP